MMNLLVAFIVTVLAGVLIAEGILRIGRLGRDPEQKP